MNNIVEFLNQTAQASPALIALEDSHQQLSYQTLAQRVDALAKWLLQQQVPCVALHGGNSVDWVVVDLACHAANVICLPLPLFFTPQQIRNCLEQAGAELLLSEEILLPGQCKLDLKQALPGIAAWALPERYHCWQLPYDSTHQLPEGTHKITFTSGSTGIPKGVCLSKDHQWRVAKSLAQEIAINQPRHLCLLPLSTLLENIAGIYSPLLCGGTVVLPNDAERGMLGSSNIDSHQLLQCISKTQPHSMILLPQLLRLLVAACQQGWKAPQRLRFIAVGGGRVDPQLLLTAQQLGLPVYEGYGLSECGSVVALNTPSQSRSGAAGKVLPHCQVRIDDQEVIVSGACHLGYAGMPDSWYPNDIHSGDLGHLEDGWLYIDGRRKNLLISSFGRNISPEWVESALLAEPLLNQCVVVGDDQPFLCALLTASTAVSDSQITQWIDKANEQLPDYAKVRQWLRLEDKQLLPFMTANGRLQRQQLLKAFNLQISSLYQQQK
ncbi:AMP-binding protein [Shewanella sp. A32]|uniref:AMP-binding protein n=1 Tax=Shewanella sp. A32 TaxID=3031327 RepID=UPI0023B9E78D|nr:AMP-binding protein [Shewanella sp. A32]MDF0533854.1 AMP-binding protein [Shewanella sp. A32]